MTAMLVHDTRLIGNTPNLAPNVYRVGGTTPLRHALGWISTYAKSQQGLDKLLIMCHGMAAAFHDGAARESASDLGYGLLFCRERLTLGNVNVTAILCGLVKEIELLACGPARTRPGAENTAADGWRFCRELAAHTNATVIAATQTQYYQMAWRTHQIDFGAWEGPVMKFTPSGGASRAQ